MATGATFAADMQRWNKLTADKLEALARQSIQELAFRVIVNTPVLFGWLNKWQPSIGKPAPLPEHGGNPPKRPAPEKDLSHELALIVATMKLGETFYHYTNVRYAMRIEFGFTGADALGRHYNQPGRFFVRRTLATWPQIVAETAADLKLNA